MSTVPEQQGPQMHPPQLDPSLGPALLLRLVGGVGRRQLGGSDDLLDELRSVSGEQVPEAQLAVLNEARGAPAPNGVDG